MNSPRRDGSARLTTLAGLVRNHPANRGRSGRALLRTIAWQLYKRVLRRTYDWRHPRGYRVRVWPDSAVADHALSTGGYPDWHEMRLVERLLRPGDRFVDVGADIGVWSLCAASAVGPTGRVFAFEAQPSKRARLSSSLEINGFTTRVEVHPEALSNPIDPVPSPSGSAGDQAAPPDERFGTASFDEVLAAESPFAARIGADAIPSGIWAGATGALRRGRPAVWIVALGAAHERSATDIAELASLFAQHGFDLGTYDESTRSLQLGGADWRAANYAIALARNAVPEVRRRAPEVEIRGLAPERDAA